jgi:hypothetical protein
MRTLLISLALVAAVVPLACSAHSESTVARDAGEDAPTTDASDSDTGCFPFCSGSSSGGSSDAASDAPLSCSGLEMELTSLEGPARACNPKLPGQCTGTAQGPCCAITISAGADTAVNDYESAVEQYVSQCKPTCMGMMCGLAPSTVCVAASASTGTCQ